MEAVISPIVFYNKLCPKCNTEDALILEDQNGHRSENPIYPAKAIVCQKCGVRYPIHWRNIDGVMIPFPGAKEIEADFKEDFIKFALSHVRKLN